MKRRMRLAILLASMVILLFALNLGVAFAHPSVSDPGTGRGDTSGASGGEAVKDIANQNGEDNGLSKVVAGNPNCTAHP